jgi:Skp family chaperone for outer membrane proteins
MLLGKSSNHGNKFIFPVNQKYFFLSVRQWRQKHKEAIAKRDEDEANRKQEVLNRAREDIDRFYEEYNDTKQKSIEENR